MKRKRFIAAILLIMFSLSFVLSGCGTTEETQESSPAETPEVQGAQTADVITLAGGDWGYPTPFAHYSRGPGSRKKALIYDNLLDTDSDGNVIAKLATEWEVSEDGLTYTFTLRSGVTWHDGEAFTAADVAFSYEYENQYPPVSVPDFSTIMSVEAVDDQTVKIVLTEVDKKFLTKMVSFTIIPEHIWESITDPYNYMDSAIGTGPYKLTDYSKEQGSYRFEAYENFWGSEPRVKVIEFVPVSEEVLAFQQGEIDRISITPDIMSNFEDTSEFKIMQYVTTWAYRLYFNMNKRSELADVALRQAIVYAIDRQQLVDMIERGAAVAGNPGILHPDNELYNPDVEQYSYDTDKAKSLLDGLGYKDYDGDGILENSDGEKLSFTLLTDSGASRLAELIQSQLSLVGIDIQVKSADTKTRDASFEAGDFEICINGSGGGESFAEVTNLSNAKETSTTASVIGYDNEELDELYAAYEKETDKEELAKLMTQMQEIVANEVPKITLYYTNTIAVHRPAVYDGWNADTYHNDSRDNFVDD
ncbi:MAG: diguanylate phosphodiesterase [Clostridia bacterium]|nr:diguanylate phosphodiesterase [Clostridia bacterium]